MYRSPNVTLKWKRPFWVEMSDGQRKSETSTNAPNYGPNSSDEHFQQNSVKVFIIADGFSLTKRVCLWHMVMWTLCSTKQRAMHSFWRHPPTTHSFSLILTKKTPKTTWFFENPVIEDWEKCIFRRRGEIAFFYLKCNHFRNQP